MNSKKLPEYFPKDWKFGTDGIRGPLERMNPLFMVKLGYAAGKALVEQGISKKFPARTEVVKVFSEWYGLKTPFEYYRRPL